MRLAKKFQAKKLCKKFVRIADIPVELILRYRDMSPGFCLGVKVDLIYILTIL